MSDGLDSGPFSMLAVSALENHVDTIELAGKKYAAVKLGDEVEGGASVTVCMIFCRGLLAYNDHQELILRDMMGGGVRVVPGEWLVMLSRTEYDVFRMHGNESLFSLMPEVVTSSPEARLARIAQAHVKDVDEHGGTNGVCVECYQVYPCPTSVWAGKDGSKRDPLSTWDPIDDEKEDSEDET